MKFQYDFDLLLRISRVKTKTHISISETHIPIRIKDIGYLFLSLMSSKTHFKKSIEAPKF